MELRQEKSEESTPHQSQTISPNGHNLQKSSFRQDPSPQQSGFQAQSSFLATAVTDPGNACLPTEPSQISTMAKVENSAASTVQINASFQPDIQCDDWSVIPNISTALQAHTDVKGRDEFQMKKYYHIILIVTVEQEEAIVDLFKERQWMYIKAGQKQTRDDLQEMCDKMSHISRESHTSDPQIETSSRLDNTEHELSGDTSCLSDVNLLPGGTKLADNGYIKVKQERDTDNDENIMNDDLIRETDMQTGTNTEPVILSSTSRSTLDIPVVTTATTGSNNSRRSNYPTLASFLAKPNMAAQNKYAPSKSVTPTQDLTAPAATGIVGSEMIKLGIRCENCEMIFSNQINFENHVINGKCQWVCKFCKKAFVYSNYKASNKDYLHSNFKEKLEQHKKECDRTCKLCGYSFEERNKLLRHLKSRHSDDKKYVCDVCFITFKSETRLYTHKVNKHTGEAGIYRCPLCPKEYLMLQSVSDHLKYKHLGQKRHERACSVCGKMCDNTNIKRHEDSHKMQDIKCDQCPAVFRSPSGLRSHLRRHDKDYSHYCEICAKGFYTITTLETHRRIHTGEKPFSCSMCDYRCNVKVNLDKHMKVHDKRSSGNQ